MQSSLNALKSSGTVFGVILLQDNQILFSDVPFSSDRVDHLAGVMDDICFYFKKENRKVDQLAFGYDGGNLVIAIDESYRIIVLHSLHDEIDFIAKAAKAFLIDFQMGMFAEEFEKDQNQEKAIETISPEPQPLSAEQVRAQEPQRPATQRITLRAEQGFDQTEPIQPQLKGAVLAPNQPPNTQPVPRKPKARRR